MTRSIFTFIAIALVSCYGNQWAVHNAARSHKNSSDAMIRYAEGDPKRLDDKLRGRLVQIADALKCPCPKNDQTLTECSIKGRSCVRAPFAIRAIIRGLLRKEDDQAITARMLERFGPRKPAVMELDQAPCRGLSDAPVTMVVVSDFECPFCGVARKLVEEIEKKVGVNLRVCFKHWPLTQIHPRAELAARAAVAAQLQNKFWVMHDKLFDNQRSLLREDLESHAEAIGLDLARFRKDLDSSEVKKRVRRDVAWSRKLNFKGTPSFVINGRSMTDRKTIPDFLDWIAEALAISKSESKKKQSTSLSLPSQ